MAKNKNHKKQLYKDFAITLILLAVAESIVLLLKLHFLPTAILTFGLPSAYLILEKPNKLHKIFISAILGGSAAVLIDILAVFNNQWGWGGDQFYFPIKLLGITSIDTMIWLTLWILFITVFYEHFFENERADKISRNIKLGITSLIISFGGIFIIHFYNPHLLKFNYAYFFLCLINLVPVIFISFRHPKLLKKFFLMTLFFFPLNFIIEITALYLGHWNFHGQYVGMISFFNFSFPFEELFYWMLLSTPIILSYYEINIDDGK